MKKIFQYFAVILVFALQSCVMHTEYTFHKDQSFSMLMETKILKEMNRFGAKDLDKMQREMPLTTDWKSLYEIGLEKGEKFKETPENKDSIALAKKMLMRRIVDDKGENVGYGIKMERITIEEFAKLDNKKEQNPFVLNEKMFQWDEKKLVMDFSYLQKSGERFGGIDEISKEVAKEKKKSKKKTKSEEPSQNMDKILGLLKEMKFSTLFRFDGKIKKIKGDIPFLKRVDKHTLRLDLDLEKLEKFKNVKTLEVEIE